MVLTNNDYDLVMLVRFPLLNPLTFRVLACG